MNLRIVFVYLIADLAVMLAIGSLGIHVGIRFLLWLGGGGVRAISRGVGGLLDRHGTVIDPDGSRT